MVSCYDPGDLQAYLDGELDCVVKAELEKHLLHCGKCCRALEQIRRIKLCIHWPATCRPWPALSLIPARPGDVYQKRLSTERKPFNQEESYPCLQNIVRPQPAVIMLALAVTRSFGSVRSAASDLLTIFRVER